MSLQVKSERSGETEQIDGDQGTVGKNTGEIENGHGNQLQDHSTMLLKGHRLPHPILFLPQNSNEEKKIQHGDDDTGNDVVQILIDEGQVSRPRIVTQFATNDQIVMEGVHASMNEDRREIEGEDVQRNDEQRIETKTFHLKNIRLIAMGEDEEITFDGNPTHEEGDQPVEGQIEEIPQLTEEIVGEENMTRPEIEENEGQIEETRRHTDHEKRHDQMIRIFLSIVSNRFQLIEKIERTDQREKIEQRQRIECEQTDPLFALR